MKMLQVLLATLVLGGCAQIAEPTDAPQTPASPLVIVNRSDTTIALLPGMVIPPCSQVGYTEAHIDAAFEAFTGAYLDDDSWIPPGAVRFTREFPPNREGDPQTVIISGAEEPRVVDGAVPQEALVPCGGAPVGISE